MSFRSACAMLVLGLFIGIYEATAVSFARGVFSMVLPIIPVMLLLVMRERMLQAIVLAGAAGLVLDVLSPETMSFAVARLLLIALLVVVLAQRVLTNHSVYVALALTILARLIDRLWLALFSWWHGWMSFSDLINITWSMSWPIILSDACLVGLVFALTTFILKRFVIGRLPDAERYV